MGENLEELLQKLINQRGPCDDICEDVNKLKLIISDLDEPVVDEGGTFIVWTP